MNQIELPNHDFVVIGAGIIDLAIACALEEEVRLAMLIDRRGAGEEASFDNAGAFVFSDILPPACSSMIGKAPKCCLTRSAHGRTLRYTFYKYRHSCSVSGDRADRPTIAPELSLKAPPMDFATDNVDS